MTDDAAVNAGDIARLAGVGRAAVSNWRRRHDDFPRPVGGTSSSPLFSLVEVERWLRHNGKSYAVTRGDRAWQRLRAHRDDLHLGEAVAWAGAFLLYLRRWRDDRAGADHVPWRDHAQDLADRLSEAVAAAASDLPGELRSNTTDIIRREKSNGISSTFEYLSSESSLCNSVYFRTARSRTFFRPL